MAFVFLNMFRKAVLFLFLAFAVQLHAQSDSIVSRSSIFVIPHASYQQETSWAPGVAYGYYFKSKDLNRISSISGSAVYTFRHQFIFNTTPKIYFRNNKWYLYSNVNFRNYPDYYYGIGNQDNDIKQPFTSRIISVLLQPQYAVTKDLYVGVNLATRIEHIKIDSTFTANEESIYERFGKAGWKPYYQTSLGVVATYDSRDNSFYPYSGVFGKFSFAFSQAGFGSTYSLQQVSLDLRKYFPLFGSHVFALQAKFDGIFGKDVPFQMLSTLGGIDMLRGFRQGKYKENMLLAAQAEYRFPIYKRFKAAVFCATGDVFDSKNFRTDKLKFAYGAGIRCRVNDARVHVRFDVAKSNYDNKLQFYITATEAF
ncbi:hypothetical protein D0T49_01295 [Paludibacter sp. 221]|uniref:BamA/TamA family outer membrane protein n=1 Tax=Paludibacter sp. 221 TaxID=2302939 RepID=UPI0013D4A83F|nr:BamA/TamA family outer membrane protein [Paludibacter sp. 221]NDV45684.1 hypothetical protein [Paludibacter sp. 221]